MPNSAIIDLFLVFIYIWILYLVIILAFVVLVISTIDQYVN